VVAAIAPTHDGVHMVSAHFEDTICHNGMPSGVRFHNGVGEPLTIPVLKVRLDPQPYRIEAGRWSGTR
jgi:hypothetical protein